MPFVLAAVCSLLWLTVVPLTGSPSGQGQFSASYVTWILINTTLQIMFVSKQVICPAGTSFVLTRIKSGQTKHVFPSCDVFTDWYCGPVIQLKRSIFTQKLH